MIPIYIGICYYHLEYSKLERFLGYFLFFFDLIPLQPKRN